MNKTQILILTLLCLGFIGLGIVGYNEYKDKSSSITLDRQAEQLRAQQAYGILQQINRTYDNATDTVIFYYQGNPVLRLQLISKHNTQRLDAGLNISQNVLEFEVQNFTNPGNQLSKSDVFSNVAFKNMKNGQMQSRDYNLMVRKQNGSYIMPLTTTTCLDYASLPPRNCTTINYANKSIPIWTAWEPLNFTSLPAVPYRIGVFTDIQGGESTDVQPKFVDQYVPEWVVFNASFGQDGGLIEWYKANETSGTTLSGFYGKSNATITGTWSTQGKIGGALNRTGAGNNGQGSTGTNADVWFNATNEMSFGWWNFREGVTAGQYGFGIDNSGAANQLAWYGAIQAGSNDIVFYFYNGGTPSISCAGFAELSAWHHTAVTIKSGNITIYKDGVVCNSQPITYTGFKNKPLTLFSYTASVSGGTDYKNSIFDEIFIYNRSLTASEINDIYSTPLSAQTLGGGGGDTTPPTIAYNTSTPADGIFTNSNLFIVNVSAADETNLSNITVRLYNASMQLQQTNVSAASILEVSYTLPDGLYYYNATALDNSNNAASTTTRNITIDTVQPLISFVAPTNNTYSSVNALQVNISLTETNPVNITYELWNFTNTLTLVNRTTFTDGRLGINYTGLTDAVYYVNVTAVDAAANRNQTETRTITIDLIRPLIALGARTTTNGTTVNATSIYINTTWTEANMANVTFNLYNSTGLFNRTTFNTAVYDLNITSLPNENYTFNVTIFDKTLRRNDTATFYVNVSYTAATLPLTLNFSAPTDNAGALFTNRNFILANITATGNLTNMTIYLYNTTNYNPSNVQNIPYPLGSWAFQNTTASHGLSLAQSGAAARYGVRVYAKDTKILGTVGLVAGAAGTVVNIRNDSDTLLMSAAVVGSSATFNNYTLIAGNYYIIDLQATTNMCQGSNSNMPVAGTEINWVNGSNTGTFDNGFYFCNIANVTLIGGNSFIQKQNITVTTNSSFYYNFSGLDDGNYFIYGEACSVAGNCNQTEYRPISIDMNAPTISISSPNATYPIFYFNDNLTLNWSASDINLQSCWYSYNSVNTSVSCSANTLLFAPLYSKNNLTFYANDSAGNIKSSFTQWFTTIWVHNRTYESSVQEATSAMLSVNISYNSAAYAGISTNLNYNNTLYNAPAQGTGDNVMFNATLTTPTVSSDTLMNFYWNFILSNASTASINTTILQQNVLNVNNVNCNATTPVIYNLTLRDEDSQALIQNGTIEVSLNISNLAGTSSIFNIAGNYSGNNVLVCIAQNITGSGYRADGLIRYTENSSYVSEFYNIQNQTLTSNNTPIVITLFDLLTSRSQSFLIIYKDSNFLPVRDAVIEVTRKYIPENSFKIVEAPKTDVNGQTIAHLVTQDVIYTFVIKKNGQLLGTFDNLVAFCDNQATGDCKINLNTYANGIVPLDYSTFDNVNYSLSFNQNTRVASASFYTLDGSIGSFILNVTKFDALGNSTACTSAINAASGTLSCTVPTTFGNTTVLQVLSLNGQKIGSGIYSIKQSASSTFGSTRAVLLFMLFITLPLMGISSAPVVIILGIVGGIVAGILNIYEAGYGSAVIGAGSTVLWLAIAGGILLWKYSQRE